MLCRGRDITTYIHTYIHIYIHTYIHFLKTYYSDSGSSKTSKFIKIFLLFEKAILSQQNLRMLYYALFHSIMSYSIIAWGGNYLNINRTLQTLQYRILKIINNNNFLKEKQPLNLDQQFTYESLLYHYEDLKDNFIKSNSITRNTSITVPKHKKRISNKISYLRAINCYNSLPLTILKH